MITIKRWHLEKSNGLILLSAVLLGLSAPGIGIWPLAWIGLLPALLALAQCRSWKQAFLEGLLLGSIYHGILFIWFWGMHPVTWIGFSPAGSLLITGLGWALSAITQGLIIAFAWIPMFWLSRRERQWPLLFAGPFVWVGTLWFLNQNPIGLPWGFLAYSQVDVPWIRQSAYTVTFWGLEALIVLVNLLVFYAFRLRQPNRLIPAGAILLFVCISGAMHHPPSNTVLQSLYPVAIQGNIPLEVERLILSPREKHRYYQMLIDQAVHRYGERTKLIVLPEGVIFLGYGQTSNPFHLPEDRMALLTGGLYQTKDGDYNGAILFSSGRVQTFGKRYLVPFGETTPFVPEEWFVSWLNDMGIAYSKGFLQAPFHQPLLRLGNVRIAPFICFEALYPNLSLSYRIEKATLFVTFSNLGWYHQHDLIEKQFLAVNRMRAAESGVPMVLATNTGVSAMIDERGQVLSQSDSDAAQLLTLDEHWNVP